MTNRTALDCVAPNYTHQVRILKTHLPPVTLNFTSRTTRTRTCCFYFTHSHACVEYLKKKHTRTRICSLTNRIFMFFAANANCIFASAHFARDGHSGRRRRRRADEMRCARLLIGIRHFRSAHIICIAPWQRVSHHLKCVSPAPPARACHSGHVVRVLLV